jgi:Polyketide cyclase / dehydrase and lipid transport
LALVFCWRRASVAQIGWAKEMKGSMPTTSIAQPMPCGRAEVFALLHDYRRRLEWDTLLSSAELNQGHVAAGLGATSLCVGKRWLGRIGIETEYVTWREGELAAVRMINQPPFFGSFAASIRHEETPEGSTATYRLTFRAKPVWLRWLLEPVMVRVLRMETRKRLKALAAFLQAPPEPAGK